MAYGKNVSKLVYLHIVQIMSNISIHLESCFYPPDSTLPLYF